MFVLWFIGVLCFSSLILLILIGSRCVDLVSESVLTVRLVWIIWIDSVDVRMGVGRFICFVLLIGATTVLLFAFSCILIGDVVGACR